MERERLLSLPQQDFLQPSVQLHPSSMYLASLGYCQRDQIQAAPASVEAINSVDFTEECPCLRTYCILKSFKPLVRGALLHSCTLLHDGKRRKASLDLSNVNAFRSLFVFFYCDGSKFLDAVCSPSTIIDMVINDRPKTWLLFFKSLIKIHIPLLGSLFTPQF